MKIVVNPDNLTVDETFQVFHKVRAIIENENEEMSKDAFLNLFNPFSPNLSLNLLIFVFK